MDQTVSPHLPAASFACVRFDDEQWVIEAPDREPTAFVISCDEIEPTLDDIQELRTRP
jgi:hypothetical protein